MRKPETMNEAFLRVRRSFWVLGVHLSRQVPGFPWIRTTIALVGLALIAQALGWVS